MSADPDLDAILTERVYPLVLRIVRARSFDRTLVDDLVQDAMARIVARLDDYRGEAPIEHWAARIAATICIDAARSRARRRETRLDESDAGQHAALSAAAGATDPIDPIAGTEVVDRLLGALSPRDRLVVHLLDIEQRTVAEVAAITGATAVGVRVRAFRARRRLRHLLTHLLEDRDHGP